MPTGDFLAASEYIPESPAAVVMPPADAIDVRALILNPSFTAGVKAEIASVRAASTDLDRQIVELQRQRSKLQDEAKRLRVLLNVLEPVEIPF